MGTAKHPGFKKNKNQDSLGDLGAGNNDSFFWQPLMFLVSSSRPTNDSGSGGRGSACPGLSLLLSLRVL